MIERLGFSWIFSGLLLIPYLCWGVYLLRFRARTQSELNPRYEAITVACLILFYLVEFNSLMTWFKLSPIAFVGACIGLIVSGAVLYGPMILSLGSHVLVEILMPSGASVAHHPQYGAAEAQERDGDFAAAANEYIAVARMFPKDSKSVLRAADNLAKAGEAEKAAEWFERGLGLLDSAEQSLPVTNRLFELYTRQLNKQISARRILEQYLEKYPDAEYAEYVHRRLRRLDETQQEEESPVDDGPSYIDED
jgi:tetratricopeptide (TPR) repeat protein